MGIVQTVEGEYAVTSNEYPEESETQHEENTLQDFRRPLSN
jgi:hypothetical protein